MDIPVDSTFRHLLRVMHNNTRGVVVTLHRDKPVGILTERDVVNLLSRKIDPEDSIERYARKPLVSTRGRRSIEYALSLMLENNIRRLIVTDDDDFFLGVITQKDLLGYMEEDFNQAALRIKHVVDQLKALIAVSCDTTISAVVDKLAVEEISSVPVLKGNIAVGIITEKDILRLANENVSFDERVELHMSSPVICAAKETSVAKVVQLMNSRNIRRVVINDEKGEAVAILTSRDFIKNLEGDYNRFLEMKLKYSKEILNLLPEILIELIDQGDDQLILWANDKALNSFGENILDKSITTLVPEKRWHEIHSHLYVKSKIGNVRFERNGSIYEFSGYYLHLDKENEKGRIQLILRDITEEVILATIDPLTNAFNRRYTNDYLIKETERSKRFHNNFSIAIIDIDDFKTINDQHGHFAGDTVLTAFTELLQKGRRQYDVLGRYGGEEFVMVLPKLDKEEAAVVFERTRLRIAEQEIALENGTVISLTASFGVANYPEDGDSPKDLLIRADERLYQAKRQGKNQVVFS